jgi:hypothetical protein
MRGRGKDSMGQPGLREVGAPILPTGPLDGIRFGRGESSEMWTLKCGPGRQARADALPKAWRLLWTDGHGRACRRGATFGGSAESG